MQLLLRYFKPSWVISVIGILLGVVVLAGVIGVLQYSSSELRPQIESVQQSDESFGSAGRVFSDFSGRLAENELINTAPLFLTWAGVGLVVYFLAIAIVKLFGGAESLREELGYVHVSREQLIRDAVRRLLVRVGAIVALMLFIQLAIKVIVPYAISLSTIVATEVSVIGLLCAAGAVAVLYLTTYVVGVCIRLIVLRPRIFG